MQKRFHSAQTPAEVRTARSSLELGDLLIAYLEQLAVDFVFGIPGGAIEPLYNALARSERRGGPRSIVARHETGAAFMADGYARQTGKLGVCCATTGPGATNLITGVASAYDNHIPMLVITAQTALASFGRGAFQESSCTGINTVGMFQYCTRYNTLVSHPEQLEYKLATAITTAFAPPTGPVHLSIPLDVLRGLSPVRHPSYQLPALIARSALLDEDAVDVLCRQIEQAKKIVFVIGEKCGEAIGVILELAVLLNAQIVTIPHGKGLVSPYHPLFRGVVGFAGHTSAMDAVSDPDVDTVVAIGTNLGEWATGGWNRAVLLNDRLIHVESDAGNFARSPMARLHVRGRILTIFEHMLDYMHRARPHMDVEALVDTWTKTLTPKGRASGESKLHFHLDNEAKYLDDSTPIKPQRLMRELAELFPSNTLFLADTGNSMAWTIHYLHPFDRRIAGKRDSDDGLFRTCLEFASMGWAIGAAVGTALGGCTGPVVCITGDGSMLMSGQEVTVAVQERLPIVFVILNDGGLGMVKHGQLLAKAEPIGYEIPPVNFAAMAVAMGVQGFEIFSPSDLIHLDIDSICKRHGPTILDVHIDPNEVPPMGTRIRVLNSNL